MKKITFYTAADKRPDFIPLQYHSFRKFIQDDYELVVLNNALDSRPRRNEISSICTDLGIRCIEVKKDKRFTTIGGHTAFNWRGIYKNANVGTAYPIKWAWEMMCEANKGALFAIIDSDMFLCRDISFNKELGGRDASLIIQYRGLDDRRQKAAVTYIWNAFALFDPDIIPNIKEMNWDCGITPDSFIHGHPVDVGRHIHYWLSHNPISFTHVSEYSIHKASDINGDIVYLEGTLNGTFHYSFEYSVASRTISNYRSFEAGWQPGDMILPHLPCDYDAVLQEKTIRYFETYIRGRQNYPPPTFLGFIEVETENAINNPFLVHYKAGSGYLRFNKEYGKLKLQFIKSMLRL
jgi:hypothetical protein